MKQRFKHVCHCTLAQLDEFVSGDDNADQYYRYSFDVLAEQVSHRGHRLSFIGASHFSLCVDRQSEAPATRL